MMEKVGMDKGEDQNGWRRMLGLIKEKDGTDRRKGWDG